MTAPYGHNVEGGAKAPMVQPRSTQDQANAHTGARAKEVTAGANVLAAQQKVGTAQLALQAAEKKGTSEEELTRLREELATAQAESLAAAAELTKVQEDIKRVEAAAPQGAAAPQPELEVRSAKASAGVLAVKI